MAHNESDVLLYSSSLSTHEGFEKLEARRTQGVLQDVHPARQQLTCADISYVLSDFCPRKANVVLGKIDNESGHPKLAQQDQVMKAFTGAKCETQAREVHRILSGCQMSDKAQRHLWCEGWVVRLR